MSSQSAIIDLTQDLRIKDGVEKLRQLGLNPKVLKVKESLTYQEIAIVIDMKDLAKMLERRIEYPNKMVIIDGPFMVISLWNKVGQGVQQ